MVLMDAGMFLATKYLSKSPRRAMSVSYGCRYCSTVNWQESESRNLLRDQHPTNSETVDQSFSIPRTTDGYVWPSLYDEAHEMMMGRWNEEMKCFRQQL